MGARRKTANHRNDAPAKAGSKYVPPSDVRTSTLSEMLTLAGRGQLERKQLDFLRSAESPSATRDVTLYFSGDLSLIDRPCVAIVGSRQVSSVGKARARRLARELCERGLVVVSGLAAGIDTEAHTSAIDSGGSTIAVIGTPLDKAYPAENGKLQTAIYREHLLVSPFAPGERTFKGNFPKRNRVMAALCDATVIVEASDTSGSLHQAAECVRLGRWLFIMKSLTEDTGLSWPQKFLKSPKTAVLQQTDDLVKVVLEARP